MLVITVAIIGGGIAGVTSALAAAQSGCNVNLYEAEDDLFARSSGMNPGRVPLHHFPSEATTFHSVNEAIDSVIFLSKMSDAQISDRFFSGSHDQNRDGPARNTFYFSDKIYQI